MVKVIATYAGNKRCEIVHVPSKSKILTDAPLDNEGKAEYFSPTDLVAAALGSCILTIMGILAEREKVPLEGATAEVEKEMSTTPRRVGSLKVTVRMPAGLSKKQREKFESGARQCPVHKSLHAEIDAPISFVYPD